MREIIFRGKRLDNGEWIFGGALHQTDYYGENVDSWYIIDGTCTNDYDIGYSYAVGPSTIGQYTGLNDKNGKRIFEGDILSLRTGRPHVVRFKDGAFILEDSAIPISFAIKFEIIGNVHDNPELLKEEAQP